MENYLKLLPKPLLEDIVNNNCIPIIGAGFSINADLPPGKKMPVWDELGKQFSKEMLDYQYTNPLDSISAYCYEFSRAKMIEKLGEFLQLTDSKPGNAHIAFCRIPFDIVCTTNFDFLLEKGYEKVGKYCRPLIEEDQLPIVTKQIDLNINHNVTLLKLHGDLHHPNRIVATEQDYDAFLERYPLISTYLANLLITRTPLFIGYSLDDPDFRQIWQLIQDRLGGLCRQAYTLAVNGNPSMIAKFARRGVKVINISGGGYREVLEKIFEELRNYWIENLPKKSTNMRDETLAELLLPVDARGRICYFAVSRSMMSFYRSFIYPVAIEYGFIPIFDDEVLAAGDNLSAKIAAVVERAELVVIDAELDMQLAEIKMALSQEKRQPKVLVVKTDDLIQHDIFDFMLKQIEYVWRSTDVFLHYEKFIDDLEDWFRKNAEELNPVFNNEPKRLLSKKEYNAAVISAITLLESRLRSIFEDKDYDRPVAITKLLHIALNNKLIDPGQEGRIREWLYLRNKAVHSQERISAKEAKMIVHGVLELLQSIEQAAAIQISNFA